VLYDFARDLETNMQARKFPVEVEYGPERLARLPNSAPLIVVMRDRDGGDGVRGVQGVKQNPRRLMTRDIGVLALFFVQSTAEGARLEEHEALCDQIVDGFLCELYKWQSGGRAGVIDISRARYLPASALPFDWLETWPGVVYEVALRVSRGVYDVTFEGEARPTAGTLGGARNRTDVTLRGAEESPPDVGCDNLPP
jgi:hypothetical protein